MDLTPFEGEAPESDVPADSVDLTDEQVEQAIADANVGAKSRADVSEEDTEETEGESEKVEDPAPSGEPAPETEIDPDELRRQMSDAAVEKAQAELERQRFIADRNAGMVGFLRKEIDSLRAEVRSVPRRDEQDDLSSDDRYRRVAQDPVRDGIASELAELRSERAQRAISAEAQSFEPQAARFIEDIGKTRGDAAAEKFRASLQGRVKVMAEEARDMLTSGDAKLAAVTTRSILRSAFADSKLEFFAEMTETARRRKVESKSELRNDKKQAGVTKTASTSQTTTKPKKLSDLSDADLEQFIDREIKKLA